ncbi:MAG: hypothetical protein R2793_03095 [Flavobacteriaceae bacterium]
MTQLTRLFCLATTILFLSCSQNQDHPETDNLFKFKEYIGYNTYGNTSIADPINCALSPWNSLKSHSRN